MPVSPTVSTFEPLLRRMAPWLWRAQMLRWRLLRPTVVGVKLLLVREGQVLLVRQTYLPGWHLPGGGVKRHEDLEHAARREAREEAGATLHEIRLLGAYSEAAAGKSGYIVLFESKNFTRQPSSDWEIAELEFFPLGSLPVDTDPPTRQRIEEYIAGGEPRVGAW